jgi:exosortase
MAGVVAVAMVWGLLFVQLRTDWLVNPQYGYGWFVPVLGLLLAWRRWRSRPDPEPVGSGALFLAAGAVCLFPLLPLRLALEANPEWRLLFWTQAAFSVLFSLAVIGYAGGIRWVPHFAFPVGFLLVAVPWPVNWENQLIQGLMRFVATLTVQILDFQGIPAFQRGNLIQVASGLVGVDEACSGVRSLQTSLFVALYLGEHNRLQPRWRMLLVGAGLALAIGANIGRTWFLTYLAATRGTEAMDAWHDTAGFVVLGVVLGGLWLLVSRVQPGPADRATAGILQGRRPPWGFALGLVAWLGLVLGGTELYYRAHEREAQPRPHWVFRFPEQARGFREVDIGEKVTALLRQTEGRSAAWSDEAGNDWHVFYLRWAPGRNSAQLAKGHRPEICLPGTGMQLIEQQEERVVQVGEWALPVRQYQFEAGGRLLHVFYCNWEDRVLPADALLRNDGSQASRLEAVRLGRRHLGQRVLEVLIKGPETTQDAAETFARGLAPLLKDQ